MNKKTLVEKCTYCGQLILGKISKYDATRCQILRLKCTKFDFRWGSAPDLTGGAYSEGKGEKKKRSVREGECEEGKGMRCRTNVKLLPMRLQI